MKNDILSESDYDITSDYETTEEESIVLRVNKTNNLLNSNLIDYSKLECHTCQSDSNNINFVMITLLFLVFVLTYYFLKKKF